MSNNLWSQPPPPPPPLVFGTTYDDPGLQKTRIFLTNPGVSSGTFSSAVAETSCGADLANYREVIEPPPPPPFLLPAIPSTTVGNTTSSNILRTCEEYDRMSTSSDKERDASLTKRSRFTGTVYDLPEDSRRPQIAEGRTFPLKVRGEYLPYESVRGAEKDLHRFGSLPYQQSTGDLSDDPERPVILTATKFVRKLPIPHNNAVQNTPGKKDAIQHVSPRRVNSPNGRSSVEVIVEPSPGTSEETSLPKPSELKKAASSGTLSRNGMSWRRRKSNNGLTENSDISQAFVRAKGNYRLRRIKDQFFTEDSNECFEFAECGSCTPGIFCIYDHKGDSSHRTVKVCTRLLKGRCRKTKCKFLHSLQAHQMPVCDYYLRRICTEENCQFLHVKHADSAKPCDQFNRGICKLGDDVTFLINLLLISLTFRCVLLFYIKAFFVFVTVSVTHTIRNTFSIFRLRFRSPKPVASLTCPFPHRYFRAVIAKRGAETTSYELKSTGTFTDDDDEVGDELEDSGGVLLWPI
ncbi:unnamed protein product [Enterobius vermicularis]|uniref:C3H1-type domain-containing protein n=1 Tax=Enterobius vermicularis TaxID=51028 RepID=A0A0N4VHM0_ENTVE|nr:unnamed protein product [Enterobius vermicularis]